MTNYTLIIQPWPWDAPCQTYGCYGRISWQIIPHDLKDSPAATVAGICDKCRDELAAQITEATKSAPKITWADVDTFLRDQHDKDLIRQVIEGATGMFLTEPVKEACPECGEEFTGPTAKAKLGSHKRHQHKKEAEEDGAQGVRSNQEQAAIAPG